MSLPKALQRVREADFYVVLSRQQENWGVSGNRPLDVMGWSKQILGNIFMWSKFFFLPISYKKERARIHYKEQLVWVLCSTYVVIVGNKCKSSVSIDLFVKI